LFSLKKDNVMCDIAPPETDYSRIFPLRVKDAVAILVRRKREEKDWTRSEFAMRANLTLRRAKEIEDGNPLRRHEVDGVADTLEIEFAKLYIACGFVDLRAIKAIEDGEHVDIMRHFRIEAVKIEDKPEEDNA